MKALGSNLSIIILWSILLVFLSLYRTVFAGGKGEVSTGEKIYREHCLRCHGVLGIGGQANFGVKNPASRIIPSLNTGALKLALTTDEFGEVFNRKTIKVSILNGSKVEGTESTISEPAFKEKLTDAEIDQVIDYLATLPDTRAVRYTIPRLVFLGLFLILLGLIAWSIKIKKNIVNAGDLPKIPIDILDKLQLMEIDACTNCGECVKWCPVYVQDEKERLTPRTKIAAFQNIIQAQYNPTSILFNYNPVGSEVIRDFAMGLYECSTCQQCHFVCPARIDTVELWERIRRCLVEVEYGPMDTHRGLVTSSKAYDNPWQQPRSQRARWTRVAKKEGRIKDIPKMVKPPKGLTPPKPPIKRKF